MAPLTLAADGQRLVYHDGEKLVSLDPKTGDQLWASQPAGRRQLFEYNFGPRVLLSSNLVLYAGGDGSMKSFDARSGKELWTAPHSKSGYRSPEDLILAGGLLWNAPTISGNMSGEFIGRDPETGEIKSRFLPDVDTYWFHHRCYMAKATERFIIPSRTGIEFVDFRAKHWEINHWVRAACLYGSMPANGLIYAGPHNCACYPEAKLDGLNALAPHRASQSANLLPDDQRLERGPAYDSPLGVEPGPLDWPTYRHDSQRSGFSDQSLSEDLSQAWDIPLGGQLSALTVANGKAFVAQVDTGTIYALDLNSGRPLWHFITGGRVDSPPTYWKGRVLFGSRDGSVYALRATDGVLAWRYRPYPDQRLFAFEQLESVWPVPGSVLVENGQVSFVTGRSVFLDGGLRFFKLDAATGSKLVEQLYDKTDPETGGDLQLRIKTLQMPVGLNDILVSDGKWTYLRSQKIGPDGKRVDIGPVSGNAVEQGAAQQGEGAHLFSPIGFLDEALFHRSYWVFGKNFAGGHNGYYQAGKYAPAGRMLVFDNEKVFGYGREPQYLKWTTTMQNQLFSSSRVAPDVKPQLATPNRAANRRNRQGGGATNAQVNLEVDFPGVRFPDDERLNPAGKAITVEAWVLPDNANGVILAHGGPAYGYALSLRDGTPVFHIRNGGDLVSVPALSPLGEGWHYLAAVLDTDRAIRLYVDGHFVNSGTATSLLDSKPAQPLEFGVDSAGSVGDYEENNPYAGLLDEVAIYYRALSTEEIQARSLVADARSASNAVVAYSFNNNDARDESTNGINGVLTGVDVGKGRNGAALWFHKLTPPVVAGSTNPAPGVASAIPLPQDQGDLNRSGALAAAAVEGASQVTNTPDATTPSVGGTNKLARRAGGAGAAKAQAGAGTFVKYDWAAYVPISTRGFSMSGTNLVVAGPPDLVNEEQMFERLTKKDPTVQKELEEQDASLSGKRGALVKIFNSGNGQVARDFTIDSPPVWDGVSVAQGRIFIVTTDGKIKCYGQPPKPPVLP